MLTHFYHSVTRLRSLYLLVAASFAMLLGACSSTTSESRLVLNLPDWQKLHKETAAKQNKISSSAISDEAEIEFLSIKVSGSGLTQPLTELWKHKDGETPKMQASFVIPRGTSVLVQVLAVYQGNVSTEFYYGDNTVNADREIVGAEIKLQLANVTGTVEGNIVGRYMDAPNHGPTGVFEYHFDPDSMPGGKPSMVVTTGEIFGGWLRAFHLNSRLLQYKWPNGHFVFDPSDESHLFSGTQPLRSARILVPRGFRINGSDTEEQPLQTVTAGFFGPGASSQHLCLQPAGANVEELYDVATTSPSAKFKWSAHSTPAPGEEGKTVRVIDPDLAGANYDKGGDLSSSCAIDSGNSEFETYLKFNQEKIASGDEVLDFRGPFRKLASGNYVGKSHDSVGQKLDLSWSFLPGAEVDLDGVSVFWRSMPAAGFSDDDIRGDDGYRCSEFRNAAAFAPSFNEISLPNNAFSTHIPGIMTEAASQLVQVVVCPRLRDGTFSSSGIANYSGGSNGLNSAVALKAIHPIDSSVSLTAGTAKYVQQGVCSPVVIQAVDANGDATHIGTSTTLTVSSSNAADKIFFNAGCTDPAAATSSLTFNNFWGYQVVYLKAASASTSADLSAQITAGPALGTASYFYNVIAPVSATKSVIYMRPKMYRYECVDALSIAYDGVTKSAAAVTGTLNHPNLSGLFFGAPEDYSCSGTWQSASNFSTSSTAPLKIRYDNTPTALTIAHAGGTGDLSTVAFNSSTATVLGVGAPARVTVEVPHQATLNDCLKVIVKVTDSQGHEVPTPTAMTIDLSVSGGNFHPSSSICNNTASSMQTFGIAAGSIRSSNAISFRPSAVGTASITINSTSQYAKDTLPLITTTTATIARFIAFWDGYEFVDINTGMISGSAPPLQMSTSATLNIFAVDHNGRRVATYNGSTSIMSVAPMGPFMIDYVPPTFSNGTAQITGHGTVSAGTVGVSTGTTGPYQLFTSSSRSLTP